MKNLLKTLFAGLMLGLVLGACDDKNDPSPFVPLTLNATYKTLGVSKAFANKPQVTLTNLTEQTTVKAEMDNMGEAVLTDLLPGNYSVSVRTTLSPEEAKDFGFEVTNSVKVNLSANIASLSLVLNQEMKKQTLELKEMVQSALVLKEIYYAGSLPPSGTGAAYRNDQFYTVYNNSDVPVSLDNIYIGHTEFFQTKPAPWPGETEGTPENVYVNTAWKIVKTGETATLAPGAQIMIAAMAANHKGTADLNPNSPVDLSKADYEAYDYDNSSNPNVDYPAKNMGESFVLTLPRHSLWLASYQGNGVVLFEATAAEFKALDDNQVTAPRSVWDPYDDMDDYDLPYICLKVPNKMVVDAVDLIVNSTSLENKRFGADLDAGFATCPSKEGKSVLRKMESTMEGRVIYQDTNNSKDDFEVNASPLK